MQPHEIDRLIGELARRTPPAPPRFREEVWREIRHRRAVEGDAASTPSLLDWLLGPWLQREPVCAALALALMLGLFFGAWTGRPARAAEAMNLGVFSARAVAAGMPLP